MRYVDNTIVEVPEGWEGRADQAKQLLLAGEITADDRSTIWRELKDSLADVSSDKCWYCETSIPRSDNAVDHYRPKGRVKGIRLSADGQGIEPYQIEPEHLGYKWDAYNLGNFRFSCQHCNEWRKDLKGTAGGKSSYFPLVNEASRAYCELDQGSEIPTLLDPCEVLDWRLLSFDRSGRPFSRFESGSEEDLRVRLSIKIYHLDQLSLNRSRAAQWSLVKPMLDEAKTWFLKRLRGDVGANAAFQSKLRDLRKWFHAKSRQSYLGFLVYQLEQEKGDDKDGVHSWIDGLLRTIS